MYRSALMMGNISSGIRQLGGQIFQLEAVYRTEKKVELIVFVGALLMGDEGVVNNKIPAMDGMLLAVDADSALAAENVQDLTEVMGVLDIEPGGVVADAAGVFQPRRNGDSRSGRLVQIVVFMGHVDCSLSMNIVKVLYPKDVSSSSGFHSLSQKTDSLFNFRAEIYGCPG